MNVVAVATHEAGFRERCALAAEQLGTRLVGLDDCTPFNQRLQTGHASTEVRAAAERVESEDGLEWIVFHTYAED